MYRRIVLLTGAAAVAMGTAWGGDASQAEARLFGRKAARCCVTVTPCVTTQCCCVTVQPCCEVTPCCVSQCCCPPRCCHVK
jgi:hypothetical protein